MNLLELLSSEISNMHLTNDEKIRYIYLRLCQLFSFDARWNYAWAIEDYKTHFEVKNKTFDITNIDDFKVICHTCIDYILIPLIENIVGVKADSVEKRGHTFATIKFDGTKYILDPTGGHDFCYVKMNVKTNLFRPDKVYYDYEDVLNEIDKKLGFKNVTLKEYIETHGLDEEDDYLRKLKIIDLLKESLCKFSYSDASHFINVIDNYQGVNEDIEHSKVYLGENYDYHKFYYLCKSDTCFELYSRDEKFKLREITKNKCMKLTKNLRSVNIRSLF